MNCPLCHNSKIKETLFVARNAFISSSKLDNLAQRKNLTGSGGGNRNTYTMSNLWIHI